MRFSAGIDLGGTFTKLALMDLDGKILDRERTLSRTGSEARGLLEHVRETLEEMCTRTGVPYPPTEGCGIGVPGVVDYETGTVKLSGAFGWKGLGLRALAEEVLGCTVPVDTDVNAGLLADLYFGAAKTASELLYVSWGTGVGAGLTVGRKVYHSRNGAMGNLGHTLAVPGSKRQCICGIRGCLEVEIGARSLVENVKEQIALGRSSLLSTERDFSAEQITQAARAGDGLALQVLGEAVTLLARTLAASLAMLNPDTVILAGGVSGCLPLVRDVFDDELKRIAPFFSLQGTTICPSAFGEAAGVIGAAKLATMWRME
jgi:glucokinase